MFNKPFRDFADKIPCRDCGDRFVKEEGGQVVSCRATCERWERFQEYRKELQEKKDEERRQRCVVCDRWRRQEKYGKRGKRNGFEEAR